ncbi:hypothetical protein DFH09DRAFT_1076964 [Mycena vulgaris]|nr:hypothetical protein DFH09DRAFT_1076964 [Mycena vulgaris]
MWKEKGMCVPPDDEVEEKKHGMDAGETKAKDSVDEKKRGTDVEKNEARDSGLNTIWPKEKTPDAWTMPSVGVEPPAFSYAGLLEYVPVENDLSLVNDGFLSGLWVGLSLKATWPKEEKKLDAWMMPSGGVEPPGFSYAGWLSEVERWEDGAYRRLERRSSRSSAKVAVMLRNDSDLRLRTKIGWDRGTPELKKRMGLKDNAVGGSRTLSCLVSLFGDKATEREGPPLVDEGFISLGLLGRRKKDTAAKCSNFARQTHLSLVGLLPSHGYPTATESSKNLHVASLNWLVLGPFGFSDFKAERQKDPNYRGASERGRRYLHRSRS